MTIPGAYGTQPYKSGPTLTRVEQDEVSGCSVACLAMVTGKTYDQVRGYFNRDLSNDKGGLYQHHVDDYLAEHGYSVARRMARQPGATRRKRGWPPSPFADVHLVVVSVGGGVHHAVVLLRDGTVYDPHPRNGGIRRLSDYKYINSIAGVYRLPAPAPPTAKPEIFYQMVQIEPEAEVEAKPANP
jgi:hypothetical protein